MSSRRLLVGLSVVSLAAIGLVTTAFGRSASPAGIWKGRIVQADRSYTIPSITLVVTGRGIRSTVSGLTGAAHDSPTATTTCAVPYKVDGDDQGWFYYEQSGASVMTSAGYVEAGPCGARGNKAPGSIGYLLRLRRLPSGKLAVQVFEWERAPKTRADAIAIVKEMASQGYVTWRGYLTH